MNAEVGKHKMRQQASHTTVVSLRLYQAEILCTFFTMCGCDFIIIHGEMMKEVKQNKMSLTKE